MSPPCDATNCRGHPSHPAMRLHDVPEPDRQFAIESDGRVGNPTNSSAHDPHRLAAADESSVQTLATSSARLECQMEPAARRHFGRRPGRGVVALLPPPARVQLNPARPSVDRIIRAVGRKPSWIPSSTQTFRDHASAAVTSARGMQSEGAVVPVHDRWTTALHVDYVRTRPPDRSSDQGRGCAVNATSRTDVAVGPRFGDDRARDAWSAGMLPPSSPRASGLNVGFHRNRHPGGDVPQERVSSAARSMRSPTRGVRFSSASPNTSASEVSGW
jgi:hypothetical protein